MKKELRGKRFATREEIMNETTVVLRSLPKQFFIDSMANLRKRYEKCVALRGAYVEKTCLPSDAE